ncbi:MAG: NAD(P)/FAD-dependent oxidoreductase [Crocinitomicaceae bacterium]|nr:NAD(P)/FAD-dependent oxidoreductase [Crocinitomicaceae bacterium]
MNLPRTDKPRIVVIGGGFAGLNLAKSLNTRKYQIVLLDRNNYHTFQPLMYQVASAGLEPDSIAYPLRKKFRNMKSVHFRIADVIRVDSKEKSITTSIGELSYDYLVIATGAKTNFFGMENVEKFSMPMKSLVESLNLRSRILEQFEEALIQEQVSEVNKRLTFVIAGGGATGVELAGALSELKNKILPKDYPDLDIRNMSIHIIEGSDRLLSAMSLKSSHKAEKFLKKLGVNIWTSKRVKDYDGETVLTADGMEIPTKTLIWAAGVEANPIDGFQAEDFNRSRFLIDPHCQLINHANIYAIGDVAALASKDKKPLPMLASVAMQQGNYLAKYFNKNRKFREFKYIDKGTMATIGRNKAVVDLGRFKFQGTMAWFVWMFVHVMLLVGFRNRMIVLVNWFWNYISYNNGSRLIIRKSRENHLLSELQKDEKLTHS